jgi:hypothetical protein
MLKPRQHVRGGEEVSLLQNTKKSMLNLDNMCGEGKRQSPVDIITKQASPTPNLYTLVHTYAVANATPFTTAAWIRRERV